MTLNIYKDNVRKYYEDKMFTEEGLGILTKLLENYVRYYIEKDVYPFALYAIFGIPNYKAFLRVKDQEDLFSRIKLLSNILGKTVINVTMDDGSTRPADILQIVGEEDGN